MFYPNHVIMGPVIKRFRCILPRIAACSVSAASTSLDQKRVRWHVSCSEFDPHVRHILSRRLGHENISTAILPHPLIQEEQLSVTGERMCTKYW